MATTTSATDVKPHPAPWAALASDYVALTKPRIAVMMLITVAVAAFVARWGQPDMWHVMHAVVGVALVAASASAVNQWLERETDGRMPRTASRPLPAGRLTSREVLWFAAVTLIAGTTYLLATLRWDTAAWAVATWVVYVLAYTPLKTKSSVNTAVGAVSGAMPVCVGWAAVGGAYDIRMASLFTTLFLWQFPHFMAIAWLYREQYAKAGLQMLTVVDPTGRRAGVQAVLSAVGLLPVSLVPALFGPAPGAGLYAAIAFLLGAAQLACAVIFFAQRSEASARLLLRASLIYLPALLGLLMFVPLA
ncbi:MAG: heme o synthase [Pirellulales bacterium]